MTGVQTCALPIFYDAADEQQALLEMISTGGRLEREAEILMTTRNQIGRASRRERV